MKLFKKQQIEQVEVATEEKTIVEGENVMTNEKVKTTLLGSEDGIAQLLMDSGEVEDAVVKSQIKEITAKLSKAMQDHGIDVSDSSAVASFILANKEIITSTVREALTKAMEEATDEAEEVGPIYHEFGDFLKRIGMYGDNHIHAALITFMGHGDDEKEFGLEIFKRFDRDRKAYGKYFRTLFGIKSPTTSLAKNTVYYSADGLRTTGDLIETSITKAVKLVNKYIFHLAASSLEKTVGGRPSEIKDFNFVNDAAKEALIKAKRVINKKADNKKAAKKTAEQSAH